MAIRHLVVVLWLVAMPSAAVASEPELINEIVAVVEGTPVTLWDIEVESRLRALEQRGFIPESDPSDADLATSLDQLINRMLVMRAADRFRVPPAGENEIEVELEGLRQRALRPLDTQLARVGISEERLKYRVRAKIRIRRLIEDRLRDLVRVDDEDVARYIREHPSPETADTALVREYLTTIRLQDRTRDFLKDLRETATILILDRRFQNVR